MHAGLPHKYEPVSKAVTCTEYSSTESFFALIHCLDLSLYLEWSDCPIESLLARYIPAQQQDAM